MTGPALEEAPEAPLPRALTEREERFVDEYDLIPNASQAALKAGYSEHSAGPLGYQLLQRPVVQAALAQRKAKRKADLAARGAKSWLSTATKLLQGPAGHCRGGSQRADPAHAPVLPLLLGRGKPSPAHT